MKSNLKIHLFGFPHISLANQPLPEFPTEKVKLLFFYLVLFHRHAHARAVLVGTFWGDWPESRARHSLSTSLWRLRTWLETVPGEAEPYLIVDEEQIAFNSRRPFWLDTLEFEELIERGARMQKLAPDQSAVLFHKAIELYHGELLSTLR